jgi:hypothetical protein
VETIAHLIEELDRIATLPTRDQPAEKLLIFRRVESALRKYVTREERLSEAARKFRPGLRELMVRLTAMEKIAPAMPDHEMLREYSSALTRIRTITVELERALGEYGP